MRRAMVWGVAVCTLLLCLVAFAEEKPAGGQTQAQTGRVERAKGQSRNLSPEERAKLREKWATMSEEERAQARAQMREQIAGNRPGADAGQPRSGADQIAALKQEHQTVMTELQNIRQLAAKEKAAETTKALDGLIARHQQAYQQRLQQMEQRRQRVQAARKNADQPAPKTDADQPASTAQKRQRPTERPRQK
jgi:hypothetical protein